MALLRKHLLHMSNFMNLPRYTYIHTYMYNYIDIHIFTYTYIYVSISTCQNEVKIVALPFAPLLLHFYTL